MSERLIFTSATTVALVHALDDAFVGRQPGVDFGQHAVAAALAVVAALAAIAAFGRLRPGLRAAIALAFGAFALVNGGLHVAHIAVDAPSNSDLTGALAAVAGAVLVGLGIAIALRHRARGPRRWVNRAVGAGGGLIVAVLVVMPVGVAITQTHKYREPIGEPPSAAYREVRFPAADGLRLAGWYAPSKNRAAVIIVHGGGGDRTGSRDQAALLARHGYGVLVYDARGRGESEGSPNAYGWGWEHDVAGALRFLRGRPDVDPERIGGLGLSTGADVLIEVAAERRDLAAVVGEGATVRSFADYRKAGLDALAPSSWTLMAATRAFSGSAPGEPLKELVREISPTPLLLIAGGRGAAAPGGGEFGLSKMYAEAAREPVEFWGLPAGRHTAAIRERPEEYERRVVGFFDDALVKPGSA
ncbi:MAG TPA: alpha/beta fold hydrolase [Solirubrobacteraceae bacterium]|nr:alpha/beta fold hydrolase [Solirubrobacteraceae bacterium]